MKFVTRSTDVVTPSEILRIDISINKTLVYVLPPYSLHFSLLSFILEFFLWPYFPRNIQRILLTFVLR